MMGDSMTVLVALMALCGANLVLIWQVATLIDRVDGVQKDMHATARRLARMEARRMREEGDSDGEED